MNEQPYVVRSIAELLQMVTDRDLLILKDLEQLRLLSTRQIQRLRFTDHISTSSATRTTVRVLNRLEGHGLIGRLPRRIGGPVRGSAANVWQLASTGERLLRRLSGEQARRRFVAPSPQFTQHTLAVADVVVDLFEAAHRREFELLELEAEPRCWRDYLNASGTREWLKPDLRVVTANTTTESHAFVEVDRGTEHLPAVLRKCENYQRYWHTGQEQSARDLFPAVVWIVPTKSRADNITTAIRGHPELVATLFHVTVPSHAISILGPDNTSINSKGEHP